MKNSDTFCVQPWYGREVTAETINQLDFQDKLKGIDRRDYIPEWEEKYFYFRA